MRCADALLLLPPPPLAALPSCRPCLQAQAPCPSHPALMGGSAVHPSYLPSPSSLHPSLPPFCLALCPFRMMLRRYNVCARAADGIYEGVAIGGDAFPGSTLSDHCLRYQQIPQIKMIVVLGEIGGRWVGVRWAGGDCEGLRPLTGN